MRAHIHTLSNLLSLSLSSLSHLYIYLSLSLSFSLSSSLLCLGESVFARCLSSLKAERVEASKKLSGPTAKFEGNKEEYIEYIRQV